MKKNRPSKTRKWMPYLLCLIMLFGFIAMTGTASAEKGASDVANHWAAAQINSWMEKGWITGYQDGSFKPNNYITRAEFMALVSKAQQLSQKTEIHFKDVKKDAWYYDDVAKAAAAGYLSGYEDQTIRPEKNITRAEVAAIIGKLAVLSSGGTDALNSFRDQEKIPVWCKDAVAAVVKNNLMNGYPDGTFAPAKPITRAEAVVTLAKLNDFTRARVTNIEKEGIYELIDGKKTVEGNVSIHVPGVTLKGITIKGDLVIAKGVGEGDVWFNQVTVTGKTRIQGGGANSIHFENCILENTVLVEKVGDTVRVVSSNGTVIKQLSADENVILDGAYQKVNISGNDIQVTIKGTVDTLIVAGEQTRVINDGSISDFTIADNIPGTTIENNNKIQSAVINAPAVITGSGSINSATLSSAASGTTFSKEPAKLELSEGVKATINGKEVVGEKGGTTITADKTTGSSGGGHSGGGVVSVTIKEMTVSKGSSATELIVRATVANAAENAQAVFELYPMGSETAKYTYTETAENGLISHTFSDITEDSYLAKITIGSVSATKEYYTMGKKVEMLQELLLEFPTDKEEADKIADSDLPALKGMVAEANGLIDELVKEGYPREDIKGDINDAGPVGGFYNYLGLGFATERIDRFLWEMEYIFGVLRDEDEGGGRFADLSIDGTVITMKVVKNARIGDIFDGHHMGEFLPIYGQPVLFTPSTLQIANINIIPEPVGSDIGMGIMSVAGKRNINYAFVKLAGKDSLADTWLNDVVGTSFSATHNGKNYCVNITAEHANKGMLAREIKAFSRLPEDYYTSGSMENLAAAVNDAQNIVDSANLTPEQLDQAYEKIKNAQKALRCNIAVDQRSLSNAVAQADQMQQEDYPLSFYSFMEEKKREAEGVLAQSRPTAQELQLAYNRLNDAMRECVLGKEKLDLYIEKIMALPESVEAVNRVTSVTFLQNLYNQCVAAQNAAVTYGVSNKDIADADFVSGGRLNIAYEKLATMNKSLQVLEEMKYALIPEYKLGGDIPLGAAVSMDINDINFVTNEINVHIIDPEALLADILKGARLLQYQYDAQIPASYPNYITVGSTRIATSPTAIVSPTGILLFRNALLAQTKIQYKSISLMDIKNINFYIEFYDSILPKYKVNFVLFDINKDFLEEKVAYAKNSMQTSIYFNDVYVANLLPELNEQVAVMEDIIARYDTLTKEEIETAYKAFSAASKDCTTWNAKFNELLYVLDGYPANREEKNAIPKSKRSSLDADIKNTESIITLLKGYGVSQEQIESLPNYANLNMAKERVAEFDKLNILNSQGLMKLPKTKELADAITTPEQIAAFRAVYADVKAQIATLVELGVPYSEIEALADYFRLAIAEARIADLDALENLSGESAVQPDNQENMVDDTENISLQLDRLREALQKLPDTKEEADAITGVEEITGLRSNYAEVQEKIRDLENLGYDMTQIEALDDYFRVAIAESRIAELDALEDLPGDADSEPDNQENVMDDTENISLQLSQLREALQKLPDTKEKAYAIIGAEEITELRSNYAEVQEKIRGLENSGYDMTQIEALDDYFRVAIAEFRIAELDAANEIIGLKGVIGHFGDPVHKERLAS
ncbi:S-layer homology domain-containing protein [Candidatus Formimonas warabiya]|uniref:SLH domain-containing protein n=1 Tax=Formimonas warabiya TaxID=1761012 RepID=A0A3G1KZ05_FORW1|nr:S-layer homology domain-containing protein [Candidatus Formimonas warabiya]ATW27589.1 hypothetical protein DCMF_25065 [Candidatus Formimonas warabiya]